MKKLLLLVLLLCIATGAGASALDSEHRGKEVRRAEKFAKKEARRVMRKWQKDQKFNPLNRPQVTYSLVKAARQGDSCWLIVRFDIPHRSILRKERLSTTLELDCLRDTSGYEYSKYLNKITLTEEDFPVKTDKTQEENTPKQEFSTNRKRGQQLYYSSKFPFGRDMISTGVLIIDHRLEQEERPSYNYDKIQFEIRWNESPDAWRGSETVRAEDLQKTLSPEIIVNIR